MDTVLVAMSRVEGFGEPGAEVKDKTGIIVTPGTEEESKNGWTLKSVYDEGQETLTITILEAPWPMGNYGADVQEWIASLVRGVQAG